ncbi:reverse transcriptase domain-containing protein (plasmid) [Clostridium perfringens]|uniref:reverse transcriptase domain-containing protein n=1 Tax=Clostridium perfringens TaxID=1502 RepID=UPI00321A20C9
MTKKNGKLSLLGIPTIKDRIYKNMVKNALESQLEARFEPTSYGFRPKRNALDAIERIYTSLAPSKKQLIFEGDFKGCFDHLSHNYILEQLENFPTKEVIAKWLQSRIH